MTISRARAAAAWVSTAVCARRLRLPAIARISPMGATSTPPSTTGGSGAIWRSRLMLLHALLQAGLQLVRPLAGLAGVEPRIGLAGALLLLELLGAEDPSS